MTNLLLSIDAGTIDWSRAQFALTAIYHWLFVPLTLGLAVIMGIAETIYYKKRTDFWKHTAQFWQRLFGVNFAMGVATGIILEFEFGTNWSNYSWFVGDIFGAPLAVEGIVAFFMESTFVAVMFFGWKKVSAGFHLASTWLTGLGATISAWWILVANAWMQYPVGCAFNPDTMRNEMTSFLEVALSPFAVEKFCHTVISSWIIGAVFVVAVSCWYLVRKRHTQLAVQSIRIAAIVGFVAALGAGATGHKSGQTVAQVQPMKLAAMEALYDGGHEIGLKVIEGIEVPYGLSMMATNTLDGLREEVKVNSEKFATATDSVEEILNSQLSIINSNMPYFGYGYVKDKADVVPPVWINFWAFRAMVGLGCLFIAFFGLVLILIFDIPMVSLLVRRLLSAVGLLDERAADRTAPADAMPAWLCWAAVLMVPLAYIASESGWLVAEFGRQPWTIQDMLPTWAAVSDLSAGSVALTFFLFLILFTTMLAVEINILLKQIKKGPQL